MRDLDVAVAETAIDDGFANLFSGPVQAAVLRRQLPSRHSVFHPTWSM